MHMADTDEPIVPRASVRRRMDRNIRKTKEALKMEAKAQDTTGSSGQQSKTTPLGAAAWGAIVTLCFSCATAVAPEALKPFCFSVALTVGLAALWFLACTQFIRIAKWNQQFPRHRNAGFVLVFAFSIMLSYVGPKEPPLKFDTADYELRERHSNLLSRFTASTNELSRLNTELHAAKVELLAVSNQFRSASNEILSLRQRIPPLNKLISTDTNVVEEAANRIVDKLRVVPPLKVFLRGNGMDHDTILTSQRITSIFRFANFDVKSNTTGLGFGPAVPQKGVVVKLKAPASQELSAALKQLYDELGYPGNISVVGAIEEDIHVYVWP